jgi:hypothetical protein
MVNVQASDREDYFQQAGEREQPLRELDAFIQQHAPHLKPILHSGMSGSWLAYGLQPYQTKSMKQPSEWPIVALAAQKNYFSLYIMVADGHEYLAEKLKDTLGKVNVGKSCIRFKKTEDLNREAAARMLQGVDQQFTKGEILYSL